MELLRTSFEDIAIAARTIIDLSEASELIGKRIKIQAYVKIPFETIFKGTSSYGSGAITDGMYLLPVNINSVEPFSMGHHLETDGKLRINDFGTIISQVRRIKT